MKSWDRKRSSFEAHGLICCCTAFARMMRALVLKPPGSRWSSSLGALVIRRSSVARPEGLLGRRYVASRYKHRTEFSLHCSLSTLLTHLVDSIILGIFLFRPHPHRLHVALGCHHRAFLCLWRHNTGRGTSQTEVTGDKYRYKGSLKEVELYLQASKIID